MTWQKNATFVLMSMIYKLLGIMKDKLLSFFNGKKYQMKETGFLKKSLFKFGCVDIKVF